MLELVRKNARFFLAATAAGLALRLVFVGWFPAVVDDSRLYADIAQNWLQHGIYGITNSGEIAPTLSRLPGYPAFLAAVFAVFGVGNFRAVLLVQVFFDLATCFLIADVARRIISERAAKAAFVLAAMCPFLANYAGAALTETLEIFFTTVALDLAVYGISAFHAESSSKGRSAIWLGCGVSTGACILLRPDGGILFGAVGAYLLMLLLRTMFARTNPIDAKPENFRKARVLSILVAGILLMLGALSPLVPWTLRNLRTMHRFQPLAPRYANDSDEMVMAGFNRWTKTWIADYTSVQEIYWKVPGDDIDTMRLPERAFDSAAQKQETEQLLAGYNEDHEVTAEIDARFAALAAARVHTAPLRYYVWLPVMRIADMWLRPRTELLPSDPRWWEFNDDPVWLSVSIFFGLLNLAYVALAGLGLLKLRASWGVGLLFFFVVLRSLFLGTLENPESRYTLECYPVIVIVAAAFLINKTHHYQQKNA